MNVTVSATLPLKRWQGDRGTYHLVTLTGEQAEKIATHAALHRLEFGRQRGFGSVKVMATIGETTWKTSVFPMEATSSEGLATRTLHPSTRNLPGDNPGGRVEGAGGMEAPKKNWTLLVSKKVMRAEDLAEGDLLTVELELL